MWAGREKPLAVLLKAAQHIQVLPSRLPHSGMVLSPEQAGMRRAAHIDT